MKVKMKNLCAMQVTKEERHVAPFQIVASSGRVNKGSLKNTSRIWERISGGNGTLTETIGGKMRQTPERHEATGGRAVPWIHGA